MLQKYLRNLFTYGLLLIFIATARHYAEGFCIIFGVQPGHPVAEGVGVVLHILFWLAMAFFLRSVLNFIFYRKYADITEAPPAPKLIKDLLVIGIFFTAAMVVLRVVFNQPIAGIWATSGALALILGFALRNIIMDLFSGLAVNIEKPYQIGDWIEIHQRFAMESIIGQVTDISWRATHVRTEQNTNVVIPNSIMTTMVVTTNFWHHSKPTRFEIYLTLDFSVPSVRAKRILLAGAMDASRDVGFDKDSSPEVLIDKTNELGVVYRIRYWITPWHGISPSKARDRVHSTILKHLSSAGLTLAYPKEDIFYDKMPVRQLDAGNLMDRSKLLIHVEIFSMLTSQELNILASSMERKVFSKGQYIVKQNEPGNSMFILFEGLLEVSVGDEVSNVPVAVLSPADYFGEMSLLTGEQRSASIVSLTDSVVYEITRKDFIELLSNRDEIVDQIAARIADRRAKNVQVLEMDKIHGKNQQSDDFSTNLIRKIRQFFSLNS